MNKVPLLRGLSEISLEDFWKDPFIVSALLEKKLAGLPVDPAAYPQFSEQMQWTTRLLRATASRRYVHLSLTAYLDLLEAVDHFLILDDGIKDTEVNGYDDDAMEFDALFQKHRKEFDRFRGWFAQHNP